MNAATKALHDLLAREWDYRMEQHPTEASTLGDRRFNDRWQDLSLEAIRKRYDHQRRVLGELRSIERSELSARDQLNVDLFAKDCEWDIEEYGYRWYLIPLNQRGGPQTADELADLLPFDTPKDYEDWLARLRSFPQYLAQTQELMETGIAERMVLPRVVMQRVTFQIDQQIVNDPATSRFYKPFRRFPASIAASEQTRLASAAQKAIGLGIVPAFRRFRDFFVQRYLPACWDQAGIWQLPNGEALYAFFVRRYTTANLTPQGVYQVGLEEVRRLRGEMQATMAQAGFRGSLPAFFHLLRTDPRFFSPTPQELLDAYRALAKRIDPRLVKVFRVLPRMPYGVEPIPAQVAPDTTTAYYQPGAADGSRAGTYYVNLYRPETRPKWEMTALTLHESVPGHHLQMALAMELTDLPPFRRYGYYHAFGEGWGLYAETLGYEMGLYEDPYAKFGQLTYDMWRAVRLVVDPGIHVLRWSRQQAINYFMENAAKQELDVVNEIDRYIAWPGQALAYKIGQLKIRALRDRASQALGTRFDVKAFHQAVLEEGALPLDILERNIDTWIRASQAAGRPAAEGKTEAGGSST